MRATEEARVPAGLRRCIKLLTAVCFCLQYGPQGRPGGLGGGQAACWFARGGEPAGWRTTLGHESGEGGPPWGTTVKRLFRSAPRQVSTSVAGLAICQVPECSCGVERNSAQALPSECLWTIRGHVCALKGRFQTTVVSLDKVIQSPQCLFC